MDFRVEGLRLLLVSKSPVNFLMLPFFAVRSSPGQAHSLILLVQL